MPEEIKTLNETPTVPETPTPGTEANTPTSVPATTVPTPKADEKGLNWLHILVGILVGSLLLGGGYGAYIYYMRSYAPVDTQVAPTPATSSATPADPTASWKTYKSTSWEIKYPSNWYEIETSDSGVVGFSDGTDVPRGSNVGNLYLRVVGNSQNMEFGKYLDKEVGFVVKGTKNTITVLEKLNVNNYPSVMYSVQTVEGAATEYAYSIYTDIKGPQNVVIHSLALRVSNAAEVKGFDTTYLPIYKQILYTFKFTDSSQLDTSNWKTYSSASLGIQLKYPTEVNVDEVSGAVTFYRRDKLKLPANSPVDPYPSGLTILARGATCSDCATFKLTNTTVAGYPAQKNSTSTDSLVDMWVSNKEKTKYLRVGYGVTDQSFKEDVALYEQIIATLKFL